MGFLKIDSGHDLYIFNECIYKQLGFRYPIDYLENATCFGYKKNHSFVAGFILNRPKHHLFDLRTLSQIVLPSVRIYLPIDKDRDCMEGTGAFLTDQSIGTYFFFRVGLYAMFRAKCFVYAYDKSNQKLRNYYFHGKPKLLYEGEVIYPVRSPESNNEILITGFERIEVITRRGIMLLLFHRLFRRFKKWILTRLRLVL